MFGSFLPGLWLVCTITKVYPGVGADIVMESITRFERSMSALGILRQLSTVAGLDALFLAVKAEAETQEVDHDCREQNCTKESQRTVRTTSGLISFWDKALRHR
jgi:hypothetical protein